jgi:hypothetical protein
MFFVTLLTNFQMCFVNLLDDKEAKVPNIHNKPGKVKTDEQEPDGELHDKAQDIPNIKRHKEEVNLKQTFVVSSI